MKPQVMLAETFFKELCKVLKLDIERSDEDAVLGAIRQLQKDLWYAETASEVNFTEWEKATRRIAELEAQQD